MTKNNSLLIAGALLVAFVVGLLGIALGNKTQNRCNKVPRKGKQNKSLPQKAEIPSPARNLMAVHRL